MTDHDLKGLLEDAVSDVEPRRGLAEIQARTGAQRGRRPWVWGALTAVAATAATVAAVAVVTDGNRQGSAEGDPAASTSGDPTQDATPDTSPLPASPTPTDDAIAPADSALPVYFVGETPAGPRLYREFLHHEDVEAETSARLLRALEDAIGGDSLDPDLHSGWPQAGFPTGAEVVGVTPPSTSNENLVIRIGPGDSVPDVTVRPDGMTAGEARLALQQLVYTAQAVLQARIPVEFRGVNSAPLTTLLGIDVSQPVTNDPEMEVQAPVWIITPQEGDDVGRDIDVEGRGAFFEANVAWQLLQGDRVVDEGFTTAEECCVLSPYSFTIPDVAPGYYELRVFDADMSGGEGPGEAEDTKSITVK